MKLPHKGGTKSQLWETLQMVMASKKTIHKEVRMNTEYSVPIDFFNLYQTSGILLPTYFWQKNSWCNTIPSAQTSMITLKLNSGYMSFLSRNSVLEIVYLYQVKGIRKSLFWSWSDRYTRGHLGYQQSLALVVGPFGNLWVSLNLDLGVQGSPYCKGHLDYQLPLFLVVGGDYGLMQQKTQITRLLVICNTQITGWENRFCVHLFEKTHGVYSKTLLSDFPEDLRAQDICAPNFSIDTPCI